MKQDGVAQAPPGGVGPFGQGDERPEVAAVPVVADVFPPDSLGLPGGRFMAPIPASAATSAPTPRDRPIVPPRLAPGRGSPGPARRGPRPPNRPPSRGRRRPTRAGCSGRRADRPWSTGRRGLPRPGPPPGCSPTRDRPGCGSTRAGAPQGRLVAAFQLGFEHLTDRLAFYPRSRGCNTARSCRAGCPTTCRPTRPRPGRAGEGPDDPATQGRVVGPAQRWIRPSTTRGSCNAWSTRRAPATCSGFEASRALKQASAACSRSGPARPRGRPGDRGRPGAGPGSTRCPAGPGPGVRARQRPGAGLVDWRRPGPKETARREPRPPRLAPRRSGRPARSASRAPPRPSSARSIPRGIGGPPQLEREEGRRPRRRQRLRIAGDDLESGRETRTIAPPEDLRWADRGGWRGCREELDQGGVGCGLHVGKRRRRDRGIGQADHVADIRPSVREAAAVPARQVDPAVSVEVHVGRPRDLDERLLARLEAGADRGERVPVDDAPAPVEV